MKILFVLTYYRPHWTGLTQYAARLAEGLARKGHLVEVLCSQHQKNLPLTEEINKAKVTRLPYCLKFLRSVIMPKFPLALWTMVKGNETVVVYLPFQEVLLIAFFCKILGKKLFLVHNGDLVLPDDCGPFCRLIEKIYYWTTGLAIRLSEKIIVQTEDYSNHSRLLSKFKDRWSIILPLYEMPKTTSREVEVFKKKYSLEEKILIGFSGRFVEEKGVKYLLKAIPDVVKNIPNAYFVFAGDYKIQYENYWKEISGVIKENSEHITLLGLIKDQRELFAFYRALSVYVQPSKTDCFPSSQIEALLSGTPSVCSDIPGARWAILESGMGEVVEPKNPPALADGIIKVIQNKNKYLKSFGKVKLIFDYQKTLSDYERLFEEN